MNFPKIIFVCVLLSLIAGCSNDTATSAAEKSAGGETAESAAKPGTPATAPASVEAAQKAGIEIAAAGPARIRTTLVLYGSIKPNAEREQDVRARYPGVVRSVDKRTGDAVKKGEVLMTVESSESLQVYPIRAPLTGQVLARSVNPGDAVDSSTVLMKVADLSTLWAEFAVFARDLGHVRPGMTVLFRGPDDAESGEAKLNYVAPAGHADSQSVVARAVVDNRKGTWVAGQFLTGDIVTADVQAPVTVQPAALQELDGKTMVFVQTDAGFEPRPVQVGRRSREAVEIVEGLDAGMRYAAKNSYLIKADLLKGEAEED
jgi:cobalt-zinc-cadmium efflux system membrane fusion protein